MQRSRQLRPTFWNGADEISCYSCHLSWKLLSLQRGASETQFSALIGIKGQLRPLGICQSSQHLIWQLHAGVTVSTICIYLRPYPSSPREGPGQKVASVALSELKSQLSNESLLLL